MYNFSESEAGPDGGQTTNQDQCFYCFFKAECGRASRPSTGWMSWLQGTRAPVVQYLGVGSRQVRAEKPVVQRHCALLDGGDLQQYLKPRDIERDVLRETRACGFQPTASRLTRSRNR